MSVSVGGVKRMGRVLRPISVEKNGTDGLSHASWFIFNKAFIYHRIRVGFSECM